MAAVRVPRGLRAHQECCAITRNSYSETGCKVVFDGIHRWYMLSGDKYATKHKVQAKLADVFGVAILNRSRVCAISIELKSGGFTVPDVSEQLSNSAALLENIIGEDPA